MAIALNLTFFISGLELVLAFENVKYTRLPTAEFGKENTMVRSGGLAVM